MSPSLRPNTERVYSEKSLFLDREESLYQGFLPLAQVPAASLPAFGGVLSEFIHCTAGGVSERGGSKDQATGNRQVPNVFPLSAKSLLLTDLAH
jgi:hypothetical protein